MDAVRLITHRMWSLQLGVNGAHLNVARNAQNAGAIAVLWISDRSSWHFIKWFREIEVPGTFAFTRSGEDAEDIRIPFVGENLEYRLYIEIPEGRISDSILKTILSKGIVTVELTEGINYYVEWFQSWKWTAVFRIFFVAWTSINTLLASLILGARSIRQEGFKMMIPRLIMSGTIAVSVIRIIQFFRLEN
ncbi:hypothetical protein HK096_007234 [Nowakowskiella sp. JEL0078]|nr:hypothetical protein HK096_007234 [Nowakowskiella sp. JEL0078]